MKWIDTYEIKRVLGCEKREAHKIMQMVASKCPTESKMRNINYTREGKPVHGMVLVCTCLKDDVEKTAIQMIESTNKLVRKDKWETVLMVCRNV